MKCLPLDSIKWVDINGYFTWESLKDKCLRSFNDQPSKGRYDDQLLWYNLGYRTRKGDKPAEVYFWGKGYSFEASVIRSIGFSPIQIEDDGNIVIKNTPNSVCDVHPDYVKIWERL